MNKNGMFYALICINNHIIACYQCPTKSLEGKTPYEAWTGIKRNVEHLIVFGCLAHVQTDSCNLKKIEGTTKPLVFIGYEKVSKAYRVYDPLAGSINLTKDVIFEEGSGWISENTIEIKKNTPYNLPFLLDFSKSSSNYNFKGSQKNNLEANITEVSSDESTSIEETRPISSKNFLKSMLRLDKKGILQMNRVILLKMN